MAEAVLPVPPVRQRVSAFVISYNRAEVIGTCLRALAFADELIVVDKSSTDATPSIARGLADRVITVPWTPTVEETRAFALEQCTHDWVLFLDDDECLSPEAVEFIDAELEAPRADIYALPQRHYILGEHHEEAYYWPERQLRFAHRKAIRFTDTVHGGTELLSDRVYAVPWEEGVCIHHLSHRDTAQWIEKANRYTSRPDRVAVPAAQGDLIALAHQRIDFWTTERQPSHTRDYVAAVGLLRAVYDIIDALKLWEEARGVDGGARFREICAALDRRYAERLARFAPQRPPTGLRMQEPRPDLIAALQERDALIAGLRDEVTRAAADAEQVAQFRLAHADALRALDEATRQQERLRQQISRLEDVLAERDEAVSRLQARVAQRPSIVGPPAPAADSQE